MADAQDHGHEPRLLDRDTDRLFVTALRAAEAKVMIRGDGDTHVELPLDGSPVGVAGTRCYMNLEASVPELRTRLCPPAAAAWHRVDRVNAYVSPAGHGTPLHFDSRSVCIVQLFGQKIWRLAVAPAVAAPARNCVFPAGADTMVFGDRELRRPTDLREHRLRPGDWLLVSRGVWHETVSGEGSVSASLAAPEGE